MDCKGKETAVVKISLLTRHSYRGTEDRGHAVALLVEALCYKPEGREF
jgi:hypothetical protein